MNAQEALNWAKNELNRHQVEGAEPSALFLLEYVLDKEKSFIIAHPEYKISDEVFAKYQSYISRRSKHEPVWYITGVIDFFGQKFEVNENVLIPRPETELLIEKIVEKVRSGFRPKRIVDIGTGSGAIIATLAENFHIFEGIKYFASDISESALGVAERNAANLGFTEKINFRQGNLFDPWQGQKFDLIVANLPYVPDGDELAPDLTNYEPQLALFGGEDGLDIIRELIRELPKYLAEGGKVFLEIGYDQGDKIKQLVADIMPNSNVEVIGDYANIDRIVIIET